MKKYSKPTIEVIYAEPQYVISASIGVNNGPSFDDENAMQKGSNRGAAWLEYENM